MFGYFNLVWKFIDNLRQNSHAQQNLIIDKSSAKLLVFDRLNASQRLPLVVIV
jgi:hypothetical protein